MARPVPIEKLVAQRVRELREARGMSQSVLATLAGRSRGQIASVERGVKAPTVRTLAALAEAMGVEITAFFSRTRAAKNPPAAPDPVLRLIAKLRDRGAASVRAVERMLGVLDQYAKAAQPAGVHRRGRSRGRRGRSR